MVNDMNYKHTIKKQSYVIAISAILLAIAVAGTSYALFFQVDSNSNNQVVETGSLAVTYADNSSAISATELLPMADTEALNSETLVSTIYVENKGSLPANYVLTIGNDISLFEEEFNYLPTDEFLNHDYIRIAVYQNGEMIIGPKTLSSFEAAEGNNEMYKLTSGKLDVSSTGNTTVTYAIKVWVSHDAPIDIIGKLIYLKVDVNSTVDEEKAATNA